MPEEISQRVQVDPMAALNETHALAEFYKNRNLLLANENLSLRKQIEALQVELTALKPEDGNDGDQA